MAKIPEKTPNLAGADILNAMRNDIPELAAMPRADIEDPKSLQQIGGFILSNPNMMNTFLHSLVNRIAKVIVASKLYQNPWSMFKRGYIEFGETIEEIFIKLAKAHEYNPERASKEWMKREIPDVLAAFHVINYKKFYKATIQQAELRAAFTSWNGVNDIIAKIVDSMYSAANYHEFLAMKYMLARNILAGYFYGVEMGNTPQATVENVEAISNLLPFGSTKYNPMGVFNYTAKDDLFIIVNARFLAKMNVEVLATAFNMDKVTFMGHVIAVDSFGDFDDGALAELFEEDPTYQPLTDAEKTALNQIPLVIVDRNYWQVYDNLDQFTESYNGEGLYWQYWYHVWKTLGTSPFSNAIALTPGVGSITSIDVLPAAISVPQTFVGNIPFTAVVVTENFASAAVVWSIETDLSAYPDILVTINAAGLLTITHTALPTSYPPTITVKATSVFDPTKSDTGVITLTA